MKKITADKIRPGMTVVNPHGRSYTVSRVDRNSSGHGIYAIEGGVEQLQNRSGKLVKFLLP